MSASQERPDALVHVVGSLREQSRAEGRAEAVRTILQSRGVACSENLLEGIPDGLPGRVVVAAALACGSEQEFHARLRRG